MESNPYSFDKIKSSNAFLEAESKNCIIVLPERNQLFIDIDDEAGALTYTRNITKFQEHIAKIIVGSKFIKSKSGGEYNFHYTVNLDRNVARRERILFQLLLGSDRVRETLSYIRLINKDPNPTLFFEKKPDMLTAGENS